MRSDDLDGGWHLDVLSMMAFWMSACGAVDAGRGISASCGDQYTPVTFWSVFRGGKNGSPKDSSKTPDTAAGRWKHSGGNSAVMTSFR
jgi:hypothetical protein